MSETGQEQKGGPIYPHSEMIEKLLEASESRFLTEMEVTAIVEAQIFETLIQSTIPELRDLIQASGKPGEVAFENAQLFISVAGKFAQGMANDLGRIMEIHRAFLSAVRDQSVARLVLTDL
jgi:hypothetical protein